MSINKEYDLIDSYKTLEEAYDIPYPIMGEWHSDKWNTCPICEAKPKVWEFNNGRFACCKCNTRYGKNAASAIPIMEYVRNNNGSALDFPRLQLRDNWNKYCYNLDIANRRNQIIDDLI
tara:strand:+ start:3294 stop:3650 length:357 start_codon:yes stop_codon:yes gene_type:complete